MIGYGSIKCGSKIKLALRHVNLGGFQITAIYNSYPLDCDDKII